MIPLTTFLPNYNTQLPSLNTIVNNNTLGDKNDDNNKLGEKILHKSVGHQDEENMEKLEVEIKDEEDNFRQHQKTKSLIYAIKPRWNDLSSSQRNSVKSRIWSEMFSDHNKRWARLVSDFNSVEDSLMLGKEPIDFDFYDEIKEIFGDESSISPTFSILDKNETSISQENEGELTHNEENEEGESTLIDDVNEENDQEQDSITTDNEKLITNDDNSINEISKITKTRMILRKQVRTQRTLKTLKISRTSKTSSRKRAKKQINEEENSSSISETIEKAKLLVGNMSTEKIMKQIQDNKRDYQMPLENAGKFETRPNVIIYGGNRLNFLSSWFFIWVFRMLKISRSHNLGEENLTLQDSEKAKVVGDKLENNWKLECTKKKSKPSIFQALLKSFGTSYALLGIYKLIGSIFLFFVSLFICVLMSSIFFSQVISESTRIGVQVRAALMVLIYRKSLRLSSVGGNIGNIAEACVNFHFLWSSAVEIIAMIILAWVQLGYAALPALTILLVLFPIQYKLGNITAKMSNSTTNVTSSRIHLMSEILTAIKLIKFYAWESYYRDRVKKVRRKEWFLFLNSIVVKIWTFCVIFGAPVLAMLGCLCVKLLAYPSPDNVLDASTIFTVLALFYTVRATLGALDSFKRLDTFLMTNELEPIKQDDEPINGDPNLRIYINDADFIYEGAVNPTLKFLNMKVKQGECFAIVGDVGAGKSSILAAIIGQLRKENGIRKIRGSISYVPHDAWLLNATLRDNILFGNDFDAKRYSDVLHVCALNRDLSLLSYSDATEIGDRGVNLSLGQRQRVSLARAVYSDADINKAIIFVTNQLQACLIYTMIL
ncbi:10597_t:CDS:10 [Diversispora eburnea]|uniref:10597_t:CDS:1 n=1 Tax=Diversispora eburnea TaxID=1213867 RepID=A0A9N8WSP8_9GLOM|nr:10597_t:CDS:10 [Diversispora eburnea]